MPATWHIKTAAWESEAAKDGKSVCQDVNAILDKYAVGMRICREGMYDGDEPLLGAWKDIWEHKKKVLVDHRKKEKKKTYMEKKVQSKIYKELEEPSHQWIKCSINPAKVSAIINMREQITETRAWKRNRGLVVDTDLCRLCGEVTEK